MLTLQAFESAGYRRGNTSIITPGLNKGEIYHALSDLAPNFGQTILGGYPPFVKDIIDGCQENQIDLKKLKIRLLFAAETFTEDFRDHVAELAGISDVHRDTLNIYGTADIGAMAYETPTSILVRRTATKSPSIFNKIFGALERTPTLAQYNPRFTSFENSDGNILLTGNNSIPLIRYSIGDTGGVRTFDDVDRSLSDEGVQLQSDAKRNAIPLYRLPFVYVYERADFSVKLYGAIIYAEHVRGALQQREDRKNITGRFTMQTSTDEKQDQYLEVNIELARGVKKSAVLSQHLTEIITRELIKKNSEYHNNYLSMHERVVPRVSLWTYEDPKYFKSGVKQRWVIKQKNS